MTPLANGLTIRTLPRAHPLRSSSRVPSSTSTVSEPGASSVRPPSRTIATASAEPSPLIGPCTDDVDVEIGIEIGHQRRVADLGQRLAGAHPEIGRDDERQRPGLGVAAELRQRAGLRVQRLHPHEHAVASRPPHGWQAGDVADALVVELAHRLPVARLGAQADLAERMAPPVLEAVAPALVVPVASRAAPRGERRGVASSANGRVVRRRTTRYITSASSSASTRAAYPGGDPPLSAAGIPRRADRPDRG